MEKSYGVDSPSLTNKQIMLKELFYTGVAIFSVSLLSEYCGAKPFYGDAPDDHHAWAVHDSNRSQPVLVKPASKLGDAPFDATVLFDGTQKSFDENWMHSKAEDEREGDWEIRNGVMVCMPKAGFVGTRDRFGDCQLHIEWAAPTPVKGSGQGRGNSGVFLMGIEVQVLDNYKNPTYSDGSAGAVYGVMPPAANALRAPGEWQSYDIIFRRPIVREGEVLDPGSMIVMCNGVLIQDVRNLEGGGGHRFRQELDRAFPDMGQIGLQGHGNPVRYRNIWVRPLSPRWQDGGSDGRLPKERALAKRSEIAKTIREDALSMSGFEKAFRQLESLLYEVDQSALSEADAYTEHYLERFESAPIEDIENEKEQLLSFAKAYGQLAETGRTPEQHFALPGIDSILKRYGWNTKKR